MKKIGIVVTDPDDWTAKALFDAVKEEGFFPQILDLRSSQVYINSEVASSVIDFRTGELSLSDFEAIIVRDVGAGAFEGVSFRFDILRELEADGIPIINSPEAIQNAANKYHASYLLAKAGLPVPETIAVQNLDAALKEVSRFEDCVIKPVFGYKGKDILRIKQEEVQFSDKKSKTALPLEVKLENLLEEKGMLYIQEFIENPGRDIRAFIVGGNAIGAIYRKAAPGSWVNNLSQGGSADRCVLTEEQKDIAERASAAIGTTFAGVDIIEGIAEDPSKDNIEVYNRSEQAAKILEVNGTPSGKGIFDAWKINPAKYILEHLQTIL